MDLLRVTCLILAFGCLSPSAFILQLAPVPSKQTTEDKLKRLEKQPWMKPMLKVKKRVA